MSGSLPEPTLRNTDRRVLRTLAAIDGTQVNSGAGVYPALAPSGSFGRPVDDALANARAFAATRRGTISFAVADGGGGVRDIGLRRRYASASLTNAMMLVAFLRRRAAERRAPTPYELSSLCYMIRISDNGSADIIYRRTGDAALRDLARSARRGRRAGITGVARRLFATVR